MGPILYIVEDEEKLVTVDYNRVMGCHHWQIQSTDAVPPFKIKIDPSFNDFNAKPSIFGLNFGYSKSSNLKEKKIGVPFASSILKPGAEFSNPADSVRARTENEATKVVSQSVDHSSYYTLMILLI
jgi:hypothetical protein